MRPRALLYARVSTADKGQDYLAQLQELGRVAYQRGWQVVGQEYDITSGTKASRPGLDRAIARCRAGGVDIFAATATDRIARSVKNLIDLVDEFAAFGVALACTREGAIDGTTPQGRAFMQVRAVFAELERNLIAERVREGLRVRRERGQKLGRQFTSSDPKLLERARELRGRGVPWSGVVRELGGTIGAWSKAVSRAAA